jgi:hypothetical protein
MRRKASLGGPQLPQSLPGPRLNRFERTLSSLWVKYAPTDAASKIPRHSYLHEPTTLNDAAQQRGNKGQPGVLGRGGRKTVVTKRALVWNPFPPPFFLIACPSPAVTSTLPHRPCRYHPRLHCRLCLLLCSLLRPGCQRRPAQRP